MVGLAPATLGYWEKHWVLVCLRQDNLRSQVKLSRSYAFPSMILREKFANVNAALKVNLWIGTPDAFVMVKE
jgi:hypothetical protein